MMEKQFKKAFLIKQVRTRGDSEQEGMMCITLGLLLTIHDK